MGIRKEKEGEWRNIVYGIASLPLGCNVSEFKICISVKMSFSPGEPKDRDNLPDFS